MVLLIKLSIYLSKVNLAGFESSGPKLLYATLANFFPPMGGVP